MDKEITLNFDSNLALKTKLLEYGTVLNFKAEEVVLQDGAYVKGVPIVISGNLRVMRKDEEGKELLLYYIKSGESCVMSFMGSIHQEKSQIIAIAEDNVELLFIPNEKVRLLQRENSHWLDYIFKMYHKRFEELLLVINSIAFKKLDQRIVEFLNEKKEMSNSNEIIITHQILAEELGSNRAVISRLLKQLEREGSVKLGRNKITLV